MDSSRTRSPPNHKGREANKVLQQAISLFRKRWWKKYKKPLKHWLITERGHDNTKRIHLHGLIWTELTEEQFEKEWGVRLMEEIKSNPKNIIFAMLTFSEESLKKLEYDEKESNKARQKAINLFRKRWWKKYKKPLKHWLITEMGHDNTKRIHLHGTSIVTGKQ